MDKCLESEFNVANQRLDLAYKHYLEIYSDKQRELLQIAQEAWNRYRDAQCEASAATFSGGTMESTEFIACKLKLTQERLEELKRTYDEPPFPPQKTK